MSKVEKLLSQLHGLMAEELINRIVSGEATSAALSVAVKFLKDNNIDVGEKTESPIHNLAKVVPFTQDEEEMTG